MKPVQIFKYLSPVSIYALAFLSFYGHGYQTWLTLAYTWIVIPGLEIFIKPDNQNLTSAEEELAKTNPWYDYLLYLIVPLQFLALWVFLNAMQEAHLSFSDQAGRIASMGMLCGIFGINVAHELGHRTNPFEQNLAKALLATSLYMHFFIEHNKGHHKRVATPEDPSSARYRESIYAFFPRTILFSYLSAWRISFADSRKYGYAAFGLNNEMIRAHAWQGLLIAGICWKFGWQGLLPFLLAAFIGILLLESVNYIEHYGLQRKESEQGGYERTKPSHSWNSNHVLGRIMLFELSRHSDHHYLASRKYQILRHHEDSPQLPTGYPGSMLLAMIPPLWFQVMHKKMKQLEPASIKQETAGS